MNIENNIIKHYLKNVYFITGTAYAGKSTMVQMLAERYGMVACGENYHARVSDQVAVLEKQPNICYFQTMKDWQEFVNRTPEEYERWLNDTAKEAAEFEVAELIGLAQENKVIVDTNIPLDILHEIADYHQVAVMLAPQSMSVERFFDREDAEKQFLLEQIMMAENLEKTMENFKACIARVNRREYYEAFVGSGFYTLYREEGTGDTREEVLEKLAVHFGLK